MNKKGKYSPEFQEQAVKRTLSGLFTIKEVAESFFGSLKREMEYDYFYRIQEAEELIFDHIEVYYNRQRSHSYLDFVSPAEFEENAA